MSKATKRPSFSTPEALLKGQGNFVSNLVVPGMLHAAFVRSPHAHARILSIESAEAHRALGESLVAVLTAQNLPGTMPLPNPAMPGFSGGVYPQGMPILASENVVFVGQAVAVVIARTAQAASDAADLVAVDYEALELGKHHVQEQSKVSPGLNPTEGTLSVSTSIHFPRVAACPMEPRAALVHYAETQGIEQLLAYLGTQSPHRAKEHLQQLLGVASVDVCAPDVGGAFGSKASLSPEEFALALAAQVLHRQTKQALSIKWTSTRSEDLLAAPHGRAARLHGRLHVKADGALVHLDVQNHFEQGAWYAFSSAVPAMNSLRILPGPYRLSSVCAKASQEQAHATATNIYRGAGRPEAAVVMERLIDQAAFTLKKDPLAYRLSLLHPASTEPRTTALGERVDSANFQELLKRCAELFCYDEKRQQTSDPSTLRGTGIALYLEPCGQGWESVRLRLNIDGSLTIASGSATQGQHHEASYRRIAARALEIEETRIQVLQGDTSACPSGIGALASRSTAIGGSAVLAACQSLKHRLDQGEALPITVDSTYHAPMEAWASGAVMIAVEITRATGELSIASLCWVDDAGNIISPEHAKAQLIGGIAQGLGQATMEAIHYDEHGQLLTGSLMDYALPRAQDIPAITLDNIATPTQANILGAKGVGEAGCIGLPAALLNAVCDALRDEPKMRAGNTLHFPLTAFHLWEMLQPNQDDFQ